MDEQCYLIRIEGIALPGIPCEEAGEFVVSFDPDARDGRGSLKATKDVTKAKQFGCPEEATRYWRQQSLVRPKRPDGRPNRPMTAYSVTVLKATTINR